MKIGFTGHRDLVAKPGLLLELADHFPDATWIVGGAVGFDTQVEDFARNNDIVTIVIEPDYKQHGKAAPFIRNREIVDRCDILIALYDGRKTGGTAYTVDYAKRKGKNVVNWHDD